MALWEERKRGEKEPFDVYGVQALSSVLIRMIVVCGSSHKHTSNGKIEMKFLCGWHVILCTSSSRRRNLKFQDQRSS